MVRPNSVVESVPEEIKAVHYLRTKMTPHIVEKGITLPTVKQYTEPLLDSLTSFIGINREVLASEEAIATAWQNLPKLLSAIPPTKRDEGIMRMCVAVAAGLFDAALNYVWNAAIVELRQKIVAFGVNIVPQIIDSDFDEKKLTEFQDSQLLTLCVQLNLISETGYFMLNQCRDVRNNFSAAHPPVGKLDEYEFITFLNRCTRHALSEEGDIKGIDIKELLRSLNGATFTGEQHQLWNERIDQTIDTQREAIFGMMHGIYCDPAKEEHARINALTISRYFAGLLSPAVKSVLINQHQRYQATGQDDKLKSSQDFFRRIGQIGLLSESERHSIVSVACKNLSNVHNAMNNFHNEPPFAERLTELATGHRIPETVRWEFVETVVTCSVGNEYGTSHAADMYYNKIISAFSPKEIEVVLLLPGTNSLVGSRVKYSARCKTKYVGIVGLLDPDSIPTKVRPVYERWRN